jgi:hypothetical protein
VPFRVRSGKTVLTGRKMNFDREIPRKEGTIGKIAADNGKTAGK